MKKNSLLIYSTLFILILAGSSLVSRGQTVTTYIYATGTNGSYITGNSSTTTRTDNNIISSTFPTSRRGYAEFDLSSIPAGAVIDSVNIGYNISNYTGGGTPGGWETYGIIGHLDTATTAASLYADMVAGTSLTTASYGTSTGNKILYNTAAATTFIQSAIGDTVSISFTGGNKNYVITGETGAAATTGTHAPYLAITYCPTPDPGTITGPATTCVGSTTALSETVSGGSWFTTNSTASVDASGNVTGVSAGTDTIVYYVASTCGTAAETYFIISVNPLPVFTLAAYADTICNGATSQIIASSGIDTIMQQNFNASLYPWTVDSTGSVAALPGASWKDVPNGYTNELGTYNSPDNTPFALVNGDTSGSASVTMSKLISPSFSTVGFSDANLTFQQFYQNYADLSAEVDISTDGGTTWTPLVNYAGTGGTVIGTSTAFVPETLSLAGYLGYSSLMLQFYYNSPYGYSWAVDNIAVTGTPLATWATPIANLYDDAALTTPDVAGTYTDTVYSHPSAVTSTTNFTYYAQETAAGCTATDSITVTVLVPASPIVGSNTLCTGVSETLTDSTTGGTWSATNSSATIDPVSGNVTGNTPGTDTIIYNVATVCGFANDTFVINVNLSPDAGTITGSYYICTGTTIPFTDTAAGGTGFWTTLTGAASVDGSGNVTGISTGTDSVLYIVSNSCGTAYAIFGVTVDSVFVPTVRISANPGDTVCSGTTVTYVANQVNGGVSPAYAWSVNGIPVASTDTFIYTPANGDVISVTLTSDAPCLAAPGTASATVTMTVDSTVTPTITINDGIYGDTVCVFTTVPYTATVTNGGTAPSFLWSVNGVVYSAGNPFYYTPSNGDVITCEVTSNSACSAPDTAISNSIVMTVNTEEVPAVTITANPGDTVCTGSPITFTAHPLYGGFTPTFLWNKDGVNVATGPDFTFVPTTGDSIYCILGSSSSCRSVDTVSSAISYITVDTPVVPVVTITSFSGNVITVGALDTLVAVVTNATSPSYQWELNGIAIPGATNAFFIGGDTVATTASITCAVTNSDLCHTSATSNTLVITIANVSVPQVSLAGINVQLLPNPNKGAFSVQGTLPADARDALLEVTDVVGRVVYKEMVPVQNGVIRSSVVLDNTIANGMYLMRVLSGGASQVIRFTVNR